MVNCLAVEYHGNSNRKSKDSISVKLLIVDSKLKV